MKQYNIYAGLAGGFGGATYQYTGLYETQEEAEEDAFTAACEEYESYAGCHGIRSLADICEDEGLDPEDMTAEDDEAVQSIYEEDRESWIDHYAVPTEEDDIDPEDLVIGYIVEDGSASQTDSE